MRPTNGVALVWLVLFAAQTWGQGGAPVTVNATVEPSQVKLGEVFVLRLEVRAAPHVNLTLPGRDANLKPAEVRDFQKEEQSEGPLERRVTVVYHLQLFELGEQRLHPPSVVYADQTGRPMEVKANAVTVQVVSSLPQEASDIRDVRGPRALPLSPWYYATIILTGLLLAALTIFGLRLLLRRPKKETTRTPAAPLPSHTEALVALDELQRRGLVARGEHYLYYSELSYIIRRYLQRRYAVEAFECTTPMLERRLRGSLRTAELVEGFIRILRRADLAKFAKYQPEDQVAEADLHAARKLVQLTREPEAEESPAQAVG